MISFPRPEYPLAAAALLAWPVVAILLFTWFPKYKATILCYMLAILYLPAANGVVVLGLPHLTRKTLPGLGLLIAALLLNRRPWQGVKIDSAAKWAFGIIAVSDVIRVLANRDPMVFPNTVIPAMAPHAVLAFLIEDLVQLGLPFIVGIAFGKDLERLKLLLRTWLALGLVYMLFASTEVRLSPQVHTFVYGYFQHSFIQMIRAGGFRPIVFMEHGLEVALFTSTCLLLSVIARRLKVRIWGWSPTAVTLVFLLMLILEKSLAALMYGAGGLLLMYFTGPALQATVARVLALVVLSIPLIRLWEWIPADSVVDLVYDLAGPERAGSLWFRLANEDFMLRKASERILTGWGGFGRIQAYDQYGTVLTTTDGSWVIELVSGGVPRFVGVFGLLTWPILRAASALQRIREKELRQTVAGLSLVAAFMVVDLLPNSFFNYLAPLVCGALVGTCQRAAAQRAQRGAYGMAAPPPALHAG